MTSATHGTRIRTGPAFELSPVPNEPKAYPWLCGATLDPQQVPGCKQKGTSSLYGDAVSLPAPTCLSRQGSSPGVPQAPRASRFQEAKSEREIEAAPENFVVRYSPDLSLRSAIAAAALLFSTAWTCKTAHVSHVGEVSSGFACYSRSLRAFLIGEHIAFRVRQSFLRWQVMPRPLPPSGPSVAEAEGPTTPVRPMAASSSLVRPREPTPAEHLRRRWKGCSRRSYVRFPGQFGCPVRLEIGGRSRRTLGRRRGSRRQPHPLLRWRSHPLISSNSIRRVGSLRGTRLSI